MQSTSLQKRPYNSLYVHVPFCNSKCGYCAFYSMGKFNNEEVQLFLNKLERDFLDKFNECASLKSIFIGGGTPSALDDRQLTTLLTLIRKYFKFSDSCEWTMESNPESLTIEKLKILADFGVNRISIGIQSFNQKFRDAIGRNGDLKNLSSLVDCIQNSGLQKLNFDLIYAIPGQMVDDWIKDLKTATNFSPDHISTYALTIEENTRLAKFYKAQPDDANFRKFWRACDVILNEAGLQRYEISNFCRPGCHCRHNYDIWHGETYLGCGPSAVSFDGEDRPANPANFKSWLNNAEPIHDFLSADKRAAEILAFGLRTIDGWKCSEFQQLTGFSPFDLRKSSIVRLQQLRLLHKNDKVLKPTKLGLLYNDDILEQMI